MQKNLKIVKFNEGFAKKMAQIELITSDEPWSSNTFINFHNSEICQSLILLLNNQVIGYLSFIIKFDNFNIAKISVDKKFQKQGYGKYLLNYFLKVAKENEAFKLSLEVSSLNYQAILFYENFGFKKENIIKDYYGNNNDAFVYSIII